MIQVMMGLKGSGKTKRLIDSINEAIASAQGDVVCIEYGKQLTYDINYRVRLVNSKEYCINNVDKLKGLLSGLHAGNFDITNIYIDNLYKTIGADRATGEAFILWCAEFADTHNLKITLTVSDDPAAASDAVKAYLV
ncbi:MAG: hypothetical protein IKK11_05040 [Oscillospiraceae bacterium]|nr:hypothetical protein [Oscillospiraceae bacterium]